MAANDIKRGMLLEQDGGKKLLEVQESFHSAGLARQGGFVSLECRDVQSGAKTKMKLSPSKMVEVQSLPYSVCIRISATGLHGAVCMAQRVYLKSRNARSRNAHTHSYGTAAPSRKPLPALSALLLYRTGTRF